MPNSSRSPAGHRSASIGEQGPSRLGVRCFWRFLVGAAATGGGSWTAIEATEHIGDVRLLEASGALGLAIIILGAAVGGLVVVVLFLARLVGRFSKSTLLVDAADSPPDAQLSTTLIDDVQTAFDDENWAEVIKIGTVLSRPLWLLGKYRLRVEIGRVLEAAAARAGKTEQQAQALIDDLGWTQFCLGARHEAEGNITHGIRLAESSERHDLVAKGERHLSGIALDDGRLQIAEQHLLRARQAAARVSDSSLSAETLAGIQVNEALLNRRRGNLEPALRALEEAQETYRRIGDHDRAVKLYHFIGEAQLSRGDVAAAKDTFRRGLTESKRSARRDGILKNTIGLCLIAKRENEGDLAQRLLDEARALGHEIGYEDLSTDSISLA